MKKVFQSYNGLIFEDEEECAEYEIKHPALAMYGLCGRTNDPDAAFVVVINDESGAASFISMCNKYPNSCRGIDENSTGVFVWVHGINSGYVKLSFDAIDALNYYFADIK